MTPDSPWEVYSDEDEEEPYSDDDDQYPYSEEDEEDEDEVAPQRAPSRAGATKDLLLNLRNKYGRR